MDTADYALLPQCVPNARFASATLSNRTAFYSSAGVITPRNRNYARMRRHMALVIGGNNSKSHAKQEQSSQAAGDSTRIGLINFGPSCTDNVDIDDEETEMALLEQILLRQQQQSLGIAQFQHYSE
ncbi:hypothetical protein GGI03_004425 [Coemansia sp. RSA 2337]|nr:hypothetical protein GGI03_004425 [Coemansia sp. RSA 2337]